MQKAVASFTTKHKYVFSLLLQTLGFEGLTCKIVIVFSNIFTFVQVAVKNNIDVFYYACLMPANVFFTEDGEMDKREFLATWKDIPAQNEVQFTLNNVLLQAGEFYARMQDVGVT